MEINQLLYFISEAENNKNKNEIISILKNKGIEININNTFEEILDIIKKLKTSDSALQTTKLNVSAGEKKIIDYNRALTNMDFATSVFKYVEGEQSIEKICSYDNTDNLNFLYNENKTIFDGQMKPRNSFEIKGLENPLDDKIEVSFPIIKNNYDNILNLNVNNDILNISSLPKPYLILGKGDININNIQTLSGIKLNMQGYKIILSFDGGATWLSYKDGQWIDVNINNIEDIKNKAMKKEIVDTLTKIEIESARKGSGKLKIGYYQEQDSINDILYTDELELIVDLKGKDIIANQNDWSYKVTNDNMSIEYTFNTNGTFTINRI